jgi:hypothetical protein
LRGEGRGHALLAAQRGSRGAIEGAAEGDRSSLFIQHLQADCCLREVEEKEKGKREKEKGKNLKPGNFRGEKEKTIYRLHLKIIFTKN